MKSISINLDSWLYALIVVNPKNVSEQCEKIGAFEMLSIRCNSLKKREKKLYKMDTFNTQHDKEVPMKSQTEKIKM